MSYTEPSTLLEGGSMTPQEKLELVERVVNGSEFSRSPALQAFLRYIAKHAISKQPGRIKEQSIGTEVLGRKPNYDPTEDNIVRVRAHELRQRLEKHFATDGIDERFIITVPKGSYVPEFNVRSAASPASASTITLTSPPKAEVQAERPERRKWPWLATAAIALMIVETLILGMAPFFHSKKAESAQTPTGSVRDFWGQFFAHPNDELRVVTADSTFALWQDVTGKNLNLGDYLSRKYLQDSDDKLREIAIRRATSPADLSIALQLSALAKEFNGHVNQLYARDIGAAALQNENVVIIGSHRSNPWVEVFEPQLNFVVDREPLTGAPDFINKTPRLGEASAYGIPAMLDTNGAEQKEIISYGLVALVKRCNEHKLALILEGLNMEATEAAGAVVTNPQQLSNLLAKLGHRPGTDVGPFEAFIKLRSLPGGYANPEVIAYRIESDTPCSP